MSNPIDHFVTAHRTLFEFRSWRGLIGQTYAGGGGGIGKVSNAECSLIIYHQVYDGATNYHAPPGGLNEMFKAAAIQHSGAILDSVEAQLVEKVEEARKDAEALAREILNPTQEAAR